MSDRKYHRERAAEVASLCFFEVVFYVAYKYSVVFSQGVPSPFWLPDAVLICTLLIVPWNRWWLFLCATLPVNLLANVTPGAPAWFLLAFCANDALKAILVVTAMRHLLKNPFRFNSPREFAAYLGVAVLVAPILSASFGAVSLYFLGYEFRPSWERWFLGDALTNLVITPAVLYWFVGGPTNIRGTSYPVGGTLLSLGMVFAGGVAFMKGVAMTTHAMMLLYVPVPFLIWAAIRFGPRGASGSLALFGLPVVYGAMYAGESSAPHQESVDVLSIQLFLVALAVPLFLIAVLSQEKKRSARELKESSLDTNRISTTGELTVSLPHELNQPLARAKDGRANDFIQRMPNMLQQGHVQTTPFDLNETIGDVLTMMRSDLVVRNVSTNIVTAPHLPLANGDRIQIQRVLLNLIFNACDAMTDKPGERTLSIKTDIEGAAEGPRMIEVSIADRGPGIPVQRKENVIAPFYGTKANNVGIGLSNCHSIIAAHAGKIWVSDNQEFGSVIHFTIPTCQRVAA